MNSLPALKRKYLPSCTLAVACSKRSGVYIFMELSGQSVLHRGIVYGVHNSMHNSYGSSHSEGCLSVPTAVNITACTRKKELFKGPRQAPETCTPMKRSSKFFIALFSFEEVCPVTAESYTTVRSVIKLMLCGFTWHCSGTIESSK